MASAYTLQILHFYGESGTLAAQTAPILGAMVDKFRSEAANTLTLAEGDTWIPGPWLVAGADPSLNAVPGIGSTALARPDIAIMNALGVNASALGNHEFDLGSPIVSGAIAPSGAWPGAQFPFITDNLDFSADASLRGLADASLGGTATNNFAGQEASAIKGKIAPYTVVTINGEKIGIVGLTTYDLLIKTSPNGTVPKDDNNPATSDLQEAAVYLQNAVDALTAAGVNKIVEVDQLDDLTRDKQLAPMVHGVDVFVAGGGHERLGDATDVPGAFNGHSPDFIGTDSYPVITAGNDGRPSLIVTTDTEFTYLGRLQVGFDANGVVDLTSLNPAVNGAYASNEPTLQSVYGTSQSAAQIVAASTTGAKVNAIASVVNAVVVAKDSVKFGFSNVYLEGDRVFGRAQEVNLGDLSADANLFKAQQALGAGVKAIVSLKNGGGLRASIGSIDEDGGKIANPIASGAAGNVSQLDVENALRFDNKLMVFDTTPQGLKNIFNFAADKPAGDGGFPQVGGLRYSYDPSLPSGSRLRSLALYNIDGNLVASIVQNGQVVPGAPATIQAVILNFTANGGDGYPIKANGSNFRFLLDNGTLSAPVDPSLDFTAAANVPANALGEQKAFEDYMLAAHGTQATAYNQADTPASQDLRIENLAVRSDAVFAGVAQTYDAALVLHVSEDAWQGDAQVAVTLDGQQVGVYTVTAKHGAGQQQAISVANTLAAGPHTVGVTFLNDAFGGTPDTDRNLYINDATLNGTTILGQQSLLINRTASLTVDPASAPAARTSTLVLNVSEDAWQGDAQMVVSVDGQQMGNYTVTASHAEGKSQAIAISGIAEGLTTHDIAVSFVNDAFGGTAATDRNLYVDSMQLGGKTIPGASATFLINRTQRFAAALNSTVSTASGNNLVLHVSEDAWQGDAQLAVTLDGQQVGVYTVTAKNGAGQQQAITVANTLGNGSHTVGMSFLNDAFGGTADTDRNLYINDATLNGTTILGRQALLINSTNTFSVNPAGTTEARTSTLVLNVSEDAWQGDAQMVVSVDGRQMGAYTVTASHAEGKSQAITISGIAEALTRHDIAVSFVNDAFGGTAATDRNLYVDSMQLGSKTVPGGDAAFLINRTQHFSAVVPTNVTNLT